MNGISKGVIKQFLGYVPIMVKSKLCNLYNLPPKALIEHHEEAEVPAGEPCPERSSDSRKGQNWECENRKLVREFSFLSLL